MVSVDGAAVGCHSITEEGHLTQVRDSREASRRKKYLY